MGGREWGGPWGPSFSWTWKGDLCYAEALEQDSPPSPGLSWRSDLKFLLGEASSPLGNSWLLAHSSVP